MTRLIRGLLVGCMIVLLAGSGSQPAAALFQADGRSAQADLPATGLAVESLAAFDDAMRELMTKWNLPGGALAVVRGNRLVLARGYGYADRDAARPVEPDALFRVASLSKPITSAAVLLLVERGQLSLDAQAFRLLADLLPAGATVDPRIWDITVRQLLQHTAGWDQGKSGDLMLRPYITRAAKALGAPEPASCETAISYAFGQPLDFEPGAQFAYSNLGYCVLGRVVERASGQPYAQFVIDNVLKPAGANRMQIGGSTPAEHADGEVNYYGFPGAPLVAPEVPGLPGPVPYQDGGIYFGRLDAFGGWIASPIDYARFVTSLLGYRRPPLLQPATVRLALARPAPPVSVGEPAYYGLGWRVRPVPGSVNIWHFGYLPGTVTAIFALGNGSTMVAMFNSSPPENKLPSIELDVNQALLLADNAVNDAKGWPDHDLFSQYR